MHPTNYGNVQPRVGLAYSFRQGKGVVRAGFGLFTGPFDYSDIMVSWQGASAFTNMNQPILPEFADPANKLVGLGPSGIVGVAGPFLASQAFHNFAHNGSYPDPSNLLQFPLGYVKRRFPNPYAEQTSLEVENEIGKEATSFRSDTSSCTGSNCRCTTASMECRMARFRPGCSLLRLPIPTSASHWRPRRRRYSIYHGGTLSVRKPFAHHYSLLANYTYSKSIDISTDIQLTGSPMDYLHPNSTEAWERTTCDIVSC